MKRYPDVPKVENESSDLFESGHFWIFEKIDGEQLRFKLNESGGLTFGNRDRVYSTEDEIPARFDHAVRHIRERLDRDTLWNAVETVEDVVFFTEATHRQSISYDWQRLPSVLGFAIWTESEGFLSPDVVDGIFERLGLEPMTVVEREVRARDLKPSSYTIPPSAWYDGPAAGVVFQNKTGGRAQLIDHDTLAGENVAISRDISADALAERYCTTGRFDRLVATVEATGRQASFDDLYERVLEDIAREAHQILYEDELVEVRKFRSAVAECTKSYLANRERAD